MNSPGRSRREQIAALRMQEREKQRRRQFIYGLACVAAIVAIGAAVVILILTGH
jgi:uncharacterized membrane protein YidH (DUF202 family)